MPNDAPEIDPLIIDAWAVLFQALLEREAEEEQEQPNKRS